MIGSSHDVYVAVEQKRRSGPLSLKACYQVRAVRRTSDDGEIAAGFSQKIGDVGDAFPFVAGRIGRVEAN